ncbi:RagB/SusD family nutrient uptake outer membrane protein [Mucilaginibacter sp. SJ]|uniref:RagB/SusD family nutrient uptake outer membrane protein n=1 Tax=Mucilaginibacter sp. SJ TaxID=3029053 RepID=UPI0023A9701A|nr:RagB/SusD family nutrient uptake outer membrane protein [Mucilaginibacter sp. SJ]WEA00597.1 RagB/SusD family nutrient uptake outer membrane protein [Mucilaginibacter sp. SJ]
MNKILRSISFNAVLMLCFASCQKVSVPVKTELTSDVFPQNTAQYAQAAGPVYVALRGNISVEHFFLQSASTDEVIFPAYGGNWYNGGEYQQLHYHTWTKDHPGASGEWYWTSAIIGLANQAMSILQAAEPEGAAKQQDLSELRMVRALAYFYQMDSFGNVPIVTVYGDYTAHPNKTRTEVFNFIESEIKAALPGLSATTGQTTYGKPTKYMAYALLAKMYLNAEYYTGTKRYDDCIAACDNVINSGAFHLEPRSTYLKMFYPDNGPQTAEFIFAIPFDPSAANSLPFRSQNLHQRYDMPRRLVNKYKVNFSPDAAISTLPSYYANFNDVNDIRNKQWLTGKQYQFDGITPVTYTTTNQSYDQFYKGSDPNGSITYQVELTPNIVLRQDVGTFDVGNDEIGWNMGYHNIKFYPDSTSLNRNMKNDIPIFRYSDILLMKAEAILRGGSVTLGQSALTLVNMLRAERTTSAAWSTVTLENIYAERCREFAWESWHRNDMIRFGKFETSWGFKTDANPNHRIFPIPTSAMQLNKALVQNPGY